MARQFSAKTQLFREVGDSTSFRVFSKQVRKMAVKYYLDKAESKGNQWPLEVTSFLFLWICALHQIFLIFFTTIKYRLLIIHHMYWAEH